QSLRNDAAHNRRRGRGAVSRANIRPQGSFEGNAGHLTRHCERDGAFAEIATDLALDGARVPALAPFGEDEEREVVEERVDAAGQRAGGGGAGGGAGRGERGGGGAGGPAEGGGTRGRDGRLRRGRGGGGGGAPRLAV